MRHYSIKNPPALPDGVASVPPGLVLLGYGRSFKRPNNESFVGAHLRKTGEWDTRHGTELGLYESVLYAAPEGSEIVTLNFGEPLGPWADKLPREYVDLALKRRAEDSSPGSLTGTFGNLFLWSDTPEGLRFWEPVDAFVEGNRADLPPIPASKAQPESAAPLPAPASLAEQVAALEKKCAEQATQLTERDRLIEHQKTLIGSIKNLLASHE